MDHEMRRFGARVARRSPELAGGLTLVAIAAAWLAPAPAPFWLGHVVLGLVAGVILVRLYRTGDAAWVVPYAVVLSLSIVVSRLTLGSYTLGPGLAALPVLLAAAAFVVALRRRSILAEQRPDATAPRSRLHS